MDEQNLKSSGAGTTIIIVLGVLGLLGVLGVLLVIGSFFLLAAPAVQKARAVAVRAQTQNNLKQLAIAMHGYHDANGQAFPAHAVYSKDGKTPLLSWRVAILPFLEQEPLFQLFGKDEAWDGPSNKTYLSQMPAPFANADSPGTPMDSTHFQVFVGGGAIFSPTSERSSLKDIKDGTSRTFMIVEAANAVPWSKPADMNYDPSKPVPTLGVATRDVFIAAMADTSTRSIKTKTPEATLRAAITMAGGETLPDDF